MKVPTDIDFQDVEKLGKQLGFTFEGRNFHNVSLGQGQEPVAEEAMIISANEGHWVILQNVHLVKKWLPTLEKRMEQLSESPHDDYRLFISAEPSPNPRESIIPQVINRFAEQNTENGRNETVQSNKILYHCMSFCTMTEKFPIFNCT